MIHGMWVSHIDCTFSIVFGGITVYLRSPEVGQCKPCKCGLSNFVHYEHVWIVYLACALKNKKLSYDHVHMISICLIYMADGV